METKVIEKDDSCEIKIKGRLDTNTYKKAIALFDEYGEKYENIKLDLGQLEYVSSAGIRALRHIYMIMYRKKRVLTVENITAEVRKVMEMTGLLGLLNPH